METTTVKDEEPCSTDQTNQVRQKKTQTLNLSLRRPTGPRTKRGKQKSRYNAVKHGIFSEAILKGRESKAEYNSLLRDLVEYLQPQGSLEELLVEKLTMLLWRHRRLLQAECAEIARVSEFIETDTLVHRVFEGMNEVESAAPTAGILRQCTNPFVFECAIKELEELRELVKQRGLDPEQDFRILRKLYGTQSYGESTEGFFRTYMILAEMHNSESDEEEEKPQLTPEEAERKAVKYLDREIRRLKYLKGVFEQADNQRIHYSAKASLVPPRDVLERLLRYEASLERAFDRTLTQLERLQGLRLGQSVPPPIKVNLS